MNCEIVGQTSQLFLTTHTYIIHTDWCLRTFSAHAQFYLHHPEVDLDRRAKHSGVHIITSSTMWGKRESVTEQGLPSFQAKQACTFLLSFLHSSTRSELSAHATTYAEQA